MGLLKLRGSSPAVSSAPTSQMPTKCTAVFFLLRSTLLFCVEMQCAVHACITNTQISSRDNLRIKVQPFRDPIYHVYVLAVMLPSATRLFYGITLDPLRHPVADSRSSFGYRPAGCVPAVVSAKLLRAGCLLLPLSFMLRRC